MRRAYRASQLLSERGLLADHAVVVQDGDIEAVLPWDAPALRATEIQDWGDVLVLPGTINAHTHSFRSLLRGFSDDLSFFPVARRGTVPGGAAPRTRRNLRRRAAELRGDAPRRRHHRVRFLLRPRRR